MLKSINVLALGLIMVLGACSTTKDDETPVVDNRTAIEKAISGKALVTGKTHADIEATDITADNKVSADGTKFGATATIVYTDDLVATVTLGSDVATITLTKEVAATDSAAAIPGYVSVGTTGITGLTASTDYHIFDNNQGTWNDAYLTEAVTGGANFALNFSTYKSVFVPSVPAGTTLVGLGTLTAGVKALVDGAGLQDSVTVGKTYTFTRAISATEGIYTTDNTTTLTVSAPSATTVDVNDVVLTLALGS